MQRTFLNGYVLWVLGSTRQYKPNTHGFWFLSNTDRKSFPRTARTQPLTPEKKFVCISIFCTLAYKGHPVKNQKPWVLGSSGALQPKFG